MVPPVEEEALILTECNGLSPKSTLLYRTQASWAVTVAFHPFCCCCVSRNATDTPSGLTALYLSSCISLSALVVPTPRKVGMTFCYGAVVVEA